MLFADPCGDYVSDVGMRPDRTDAEFHTYICGPANPRADPGCSNQANNISCRPARVDSYPSAVTYLEPNAKTFPDVGSSRSYASANHSIGGAPR